MRLFGLLLLLLSALTVGAQQVRSVIPYRMVGGKMIVDMQMNGETRSFVFDTGAGKTSLTGEVCDELGLATVDSMRITDVNSKQVAYPLVMIEPKSVIRKYVFPWLCL